MSELVRETLAAVLGHAAPEGVDAERPFQELGLDSMTAVELRDRLGKAVGIPLSATMIFDHPTPDALATHLLARIAPNGPADAPDARSVAAELDRLEAALASAPRDGEERAGVAERLRLLLSRLDVPEAPGTGRSAPEIELASTDEIFDFIDNELGRTSR